MVSLATLEKLSKLWPGGSYLVMRITPIVPSDRTHIYIWFKYNFQKVKGFIYTEGFGSTEPGDPYLSSFPQNYSIFYYQFFY